MDEIVDKIAALGVPALVLIVAMSASGWAGAAAITAALAGLGGPLGMLGGVALLVVLALISKALATWGFERVFVATMKRLRRKGITKKDIRRKMQSYPISRGMKLKVLDALDKLG